MPPSRSTRRPLRLLDHRHFPADWLCPFRDDDDAEARAEFVARADALRDLLSVERDLGDQDHVCPAGESGVERDPPRVSTHHFHHHHAVVCFCRRMQAIDRFRREAHRRIESEGVGGFDDVVVDGLGNADEADASLEEFVRDRERAVAADHDQRVKLQLVEHLDTALGIIALATAGIDGIREGISAVGGAEDRAADPENAGDVPRGQKPRSVRLDESIKAVLDAEHLALAIDGRFDDGADHGVEAGGIAAARHHPDALHRRRHPAIIACGRYEPAT